MDSRLLIFSLSIFIWDGGESCSYPEYIQNTTWRDNTKGRVTYGVNTMEGWAFTAFSQLISDWECFLSDNHFIVSRSSTTIKVFGAEVYAYLCQKPSLIGENAIYYYAMTDEEENAGKERVHVTAADVSEVCTVCNPKSSPTDEEFRVLLREGTSEAPPLSGTLVVGCNPCVLQCDLPGSPPIPTTTTPQPIRKSATVTRKKPPIKATETDDEKIKHTANAGVVVGIVIAVLALLSIAIGGTVWYFRFKK
uniref:Uncharacterized protein LOC111122958 isoform X1 n=1 Tax=Crassostrea virginica TaxID=6565 RepID=A0A8B8CYN8_CRAVI|nr:uncharacterized protein LOC111122958 isoform X1 [Crassostrea virginica]